MMKTLARGCNFAGRVQPSPILKQRAILDVHRTCETVKMRNITVAVDEETHRRARIRAAELDTSVSALVREFLRRLVPRDRRRDRVESQPLETALERRRRLFDEVFADFDARGVGLRMADNLPRAALHDRSVIPSEADPDSRPNVDG